MNFVLLTNTACGPGVTLGDDKKPYIYDSIAEVKADLAELDDDESEAVMVMQNSQGDWFDGYGRNLSEVARRQ